MSGLIHENVPVVPTVDPLTVETLRVLEQARERIEKGWIKGSEFRVIKVKRLPWSKLREQDSYCLRGALLHPHLDRRAYDEVSECLPRWGAEVDRFLQRFRIYEGTTGLGSRRSWRASTRRSVTG